MRGAWLYALFCLAVVGSYTLARHEGWVLFGTGLLAANGGNGSTGGHGSGTSLGSHK